MKVGIDQRPERLGAFQPWIELEAQLAGQVRSGRWPVHDDLVDPVRSCATSSAVALQA